MSSPTLVTEYKQLSPDVRRKYYISGPQWAAAYQGQALFHAPTRPAIDFETVIRKYAEIGIGFTSEHPFHRYLKRTMVLNQLFGTSSDLSTAVGADVLRTGTVPAILPL